MKKTVIILLTLTLVLAACGRETPGLEPAPSSISADTQPAVAQDVNPPQAHQTAVADAKIMAAQAFDPLIQIGNSVITLPAAYQDLIAAGAENTDTRYSNTYLVDAQSYHIVSFHVNGTEIKLYLHNDSTERVQIQDCTAKSIFSTQGSEVFYPAGVHVGMEHDDLIAAWGHPSEDTSKSHEDKLTYYYFQYPFEPRSLKLPSLSLGGGAKLASATGNNYIVYIDRNTSLVTNISRAFTEGAEATELFEDSKEFTLILSGETLNLRYSLPAGFYHNAYTLGGRRVSVLLADGTIYVATIDIPLSATKILEGKSPIQSLTESLGYAGITDVKVLSEDETSVYVAGYLAADDSIITAVGGLAFNGWSYVSYDAHMIPLDPEGSITPEAQAAFEKLFEGFILSMRID